MLPEKDVQFVAVCDPQKSRREIVKKLVDEYLWQYRLRALQRHSRVSRGADRHRCRVERDG